MKDGVRDFDLDVEVAASGFSKGDRLVLEEVRPSSFLFFFSLVSSMTDEGPFANQSVHGSDSRRR